MNAIELSHVTKIYRKGFRGIRVPAVVDCSFSVRTGTVTGFVGPNGAGKTTAIKMMLGLVRPTAGSVTIRGVNARLAEARRGVAYVSEIPYFYGHLTALESLSFTYRLHRFDPKNLTTEVIRVLAAVELDPYKLRGKRLRELSKGMQQRLNMAHALIGNPDIFIFDEPLSGLDPLGRRLFRTIFRDIASSGRTLFFSTHVLDDLESICDELVVLDKGKLSFFGRIDELIERGTEGTEILVDRCDPYIIEELNGCRAVEMAGGGQRIFVPSTKNVKEITAHLCIKGVIPTGIIPVRRPLEEVLYAPKEES